MYLNPIRELPEDLRLDQISKREFESTPPEYTTHIMSKSPHVWTLQNANGNNLLVVGLYQPHIIGPPELWILLGEAFRYNLRRSLIEARKALRYIMTLYPRIRVRVDAEHPQGSHFAEAMGFKRLLEEDHRFGRDYLVYEVHV